MRLAVTLFFVFAMESALSAVLTASDDPCGKAAANGGVWHASLHPAMVVTSIGTVEPHISPCYAAPCPTRRTATPGSGSRDSGTVHTP